MSKHENHGLYIDGIWVNSVSGETFASDNPCKPKQILGIFQKGCKEDVDLAIEAAEKAFPGWSEMPAPKRGSILLSRGGSQNLYFAEITSCLCVINW